MPSNIKEAITVFIVLILVQFCIEQECGYGPPRKQEHIMAKPQAVRYDSAASAHQYKHADAAVAKANW